MVRIAGIIVLIGCVLILKADNDIKWTSVVMILTGLASQKTGTAQMGSNALLSFLGSIHPVVLLGGVFLPTTAFLKPVGNAQT